MRGRGAVAVAGAVVAVAVIAWLSLGDARDAPRAAERAAAGPAGPADDVAVRLDRDDEVAVAGASGARTAAPSAVESAELAAESAPTPVGATLRGRVVTREGRPIAGARVAALALGADALLSTRERVPREVAAPLDGAEPSGAWAEAVWGESGADGRFALAGVAPGIVSLAVRAKGRAPLDRPWLGMPADGIDVGELALGVGVRVEGRVVDHAGVPVVGAAVSVRVEDALSAGWPTRRFAPAATSTADGAFAIDGLAPGAVELEAAFEGVAPGTFEGRIDHGTLQDVVVALAPPRRIAGRVVTQDGAPLPPVVVRAQPDGRRNRGGPTMDGDDARTVVPDADGAFAFDALESDGEWRLTVRGEGASLGGSAGRLASATVTPGVEDVVLEVAAPREVRVRAVDDATGELVPALEIAVDRPSDGAAAALVDGAFVAHLRFGSPRDGRFALQLRAPEHHAHVVMVQGAGERLDLGEVRLVPCTYLELRVTDAATGTPVVGARANVVHDPSVNRGPRQRDQWPLLRAAHEPETTDAEGRARLVRLDDSRANLWVEAGGYGRFEQWLGAPTGEPLEVRLEPPAHARLRTLAGGRPVAGVIVRVERMLEAEDFDVPDQSSERERVFVTDSEGEARVPAVVGARYTFAVPLADDARRDLVGGLARMTRDGDTWVLELSELATLEGRITRHGEPLVGARVAAFHGGSRGGAWLGEVVTGVDGTYELGPLPAAALEGTVAHADLAVATDWRHELMPGRNVLDVDVAPTVLLGKLVDDRGLAVAGHELHLTAPPAPTAQPWNRATRHMGPVTTDAEGRFRFDELPPSTTLRLRIARETHVMPDPFVLEPGEVRDAGRIVAPRAARLVVRFPESAPEPYGRRAMVVVQHAGGERAMNIGRGGSATFAGLPPGTCTVRLRSYDRKTLALHEGIELEPDRTQQFDLGGS